MPHVDRQIEIHLPRRGAAEVQREELASLVEQFNAEQDPAERVRLYIEIQRLRRSLGIGGVQ